MLTGLFIWQSGVLLIELWKSISPLCNPVQMCWDSRVVPHCSFPYWLFIDSKTVSHKCTCEGGVNLPSQRLRRSTCEPHLEASTASAAGWWAGVVQSRSDRSWARRGARLCCGEAFVCCLSQGESVLSGPRIGTARLKAEKRKKEKYTSARKDCFQHFRILFWSLS